MEEEFTKRCIAAYKGELSKRELLSLQMEMSRRLVLLKLGISMDSDVKVNFIDEKEW